MAARVGLHGAKPVDHMTAPENEYLVRPVRRIGISLASHIDSPGANIRFNHFFHLMR